MTADPRPVLHCIVPVLNEEPNVPVLMASLRNLADRLSDEFALKPLFVDDGSTDATAAILRAQGDGLGTVVLSHDLNRGPGAAFATAFEHLHGALAPGDWVVTMEGDNTSSVQTLEHMLVRRGEGYDAVLASPYLYGGGFTEVRFHRLAMSHVANGLIKMVLGLRGIQTFSSFFRLYSGDLVDRLQQAYGPRILASSGFECMVELLAKMVAIDARISEVEQIVDWSRRRGTSKMRVLRTIKGYLRLLMLRNALVPHPRTGPQPVLTDQAGPR